MSNRQTHCARGHELNEENTRVDLGSGNRSCKTCGRAAAKARGPRVVTAEQRARKIAQDAQRYQENREEYKQKNKTWYWSTYRDRLLTAIGWTRSLFDSVFSKQQGKCAICDLVLTQGIKGDPRKACADHEHSDPPKPRGILCPQCNLGIGNFKDSPEILKKAVTYLEQYEKRD